MARREVAARRYAEAAFEVALRDDAVVAWRSGLDATAAVAADPRVAHMLANPAVPVETRTSMADKIFAKVAERSVLNLIGLMIRRGRVDQLPEVAAQFRRLDNARQGITIATATSAAPLSEDEVHALTERMEKFTGGRVELDVQVDPSLLGGVVVRVGDRLIDGSVRGRLERLRNQLVSGAL
jgi:F-type H+-transporting ATPase subunit delta